jgi:DNA anti-recombination protein RmuC
MSSPNNLTEDLKLVLDITSRLDERAKIIADGQQKIDNRLDHFANDYNNLVSKVRVLESKNIGKIIDDLKDLEERISRMRGRVEKLEDHKEGITDKLKLASSYIFQGSFIILVCYILYRLGLSTPPMP